MWNAEEDANLFSEDCLHLNIQVPEHALVNKEKLPMVAYIHGGSMNFGSNNKDLSSLVNQDNFIYNTCKKSVLVKKCVYDITYII